MGETSVEKSETSENSADWALPSKRIILPDCF